MTCASVPLLFTADTGISFLACSARRLTTVLMEVHKIKFVTGLIFAKMGGIGVETVRFIKGT